MRLMLRNVAAAAVGALLLMLTSLPVAGAAEPAPQLSVTLTSDQETVSAGDNVTYTGEVRNRGGAEVAVTIMLGAPAYVELAQAKDATVEESEATWVTSIAPGQSATFTIKARIGDIPGTERRVTTTARVYVDDAKTPLVATANASFITGVDDAPSQVATSPANGENDPSALIVWMVAGGALLAMIVVGVLFALLRRNRRVAAADRRTGDETGVEDRAGERPD